MIRVKNNYSERSTKEVTYKYRRGSQDISGSIKPTDPVQKLVCGDDGYLYLQAKGEISNIILSNQKDYIKLICDSENKNNTWGIMTQDECDIEVLPIT